VLELFDVYSVVDFSIMVLSSGSWPFQQSASFTLPTEVSAMWLLNNAGCNSLRWLPCALQTSELVSHGDGMMGILQNETIVAGPQP